MLSADSDAVRRERIFVGHLRGRKYLLTQKGCTEKARDLLNLLEENYDAGQVYRWRDDGDENCDSLDENNDDALEEEDEGEVKRAKEMKQQQNELMLGERDQITTIPVHSHSGGGPAVTSVMSGFLSGTPTSISDKEVLQVHGTGAAEYASAPNPLLLFLMSRPEPSPRALQSNALKVGSTGSKRDLRHRACGFDPGICLARNWIELLHGFGPEIFKRMQSVNQESLQLEHMDRNHGNVRPPDVSGHRLFGGIPM
eukprot:gene153-154_t